MPDMNAREPNQVSSEKIASSTPRPESANRGEAHDSSIALTAIVVAYNSANTIGGTITHLEQVTASLDLEILVVDNASADETADAAAPAVRRGRVIRSEENLGFGGGVNLGLQSARGKFALIMNDDVHPQPDAIKEMMKVAEDQSVGLAGANMVDLDGSPSFAVRKHLPGLRDEIARVADLLRGQSSRVGYPSGDSPVEVGMLICACVMGRTELLRRVGGFNGAFFMYGEDIDLCRRLKASGHRLITVPAAVAIHERDISPERRFGDRDFVRRILQARDLYYRIWLSRAERIAVNLFRAFGPSDQPFRFKYHGAKAVRDGPSLAHLRDLQPLASEYDP